VVPAARIPVHTARAVPQLENMFSKGNEAQLLQFPLRHEIDAAGPSQCNNCAGGGKGQLRPILDIVEAWKEMAKTTSAPPLGVALTTKDFIDKQPGQVEAFIRATLKAVKWGSGNRASVASILQSSANLPEADARAYASLWDTIYLASMTAADVQALKEQNKIFAGNGAAEGIAPSSIFDTAPFAAATK
jgi:ABC-type nitrate/sulfonate/bicarbonate transport system substrate-binding protein